MWDEHKLDGETQEQREWYTLRTRKLLADAKKKTWPENRQLMLVAGYSIPFDADSDYMREFLYNMQRTVYPGRSGGIY